MADLRIESSRWGPCGDAVYRKDLSSVVRLRPTVDQGLSIFRAGARSVTFWLSFLCESGLKGVHGVCAFFMLILICSWLGRCYISCICCSNMLASCISVFPPVGVYPNVSQCIPMYPNVFIYVHIDMTFLGLSSCFMGGLAALVVVFPAAMSCASDDLFGN